MHTKNNKDRYRDRYKRIDNQFKKAIGQKKLIKEIVEEKNNGEK